MAQVGSSILTICDLLVGNREQRPVGIGIALQTAARSHHSAFFYLLDSAPPAMAPRRVREDALLVEAKRKKTTKFTNKQICDYYMKPVLDDLGHPTGRYLCRCGRTYQKSGSGYTNLTGHIKNVHKDFVTVMQAALPSETGSLFCFLENQAMNMYKWINWIVMCDLPYAFVDNKLTRDNCLLDPVCSRSVSACVLALVEGVEQTIARLLPSRFGIIIDGWTHNSEHYVAVFASFSKRTVLLAFAPLVDNGRGDHTAISHVEFLRTTLSYYNKTLLDVVYMVGDNCSVNKAVAEEAGFPLIGCASHRLNLASKAIFQPFEAAISKVHDTMVKLRTLNESAWLRYYTPLRPIVNQDTRWDSTYAMLKRYTQIADFLEKSPTLCDIIPNEFERRQIQRLLEDLRAVKDVSKDLQGATATMAKTRMLFDGLIQRHADFAKYLSPDADIVKYKDFENACVKAARKQPLSIAERATVAKLIDIAAPTPSAPDASSADQQNTKKRATFVEECEAKAKKDDVPHETFTLAVEAPPTSNVAERLFSSAKHVVGERRHRLKPQSFEALLYLKSNNEAWDVADVAAAMKRTAERTSTARSNESAVE